MATITRMGVVLGIGGMITAPIVAIVAMFQGERLASVYLAFALPLLVAAIVIGHPLFIND